MQHNLFCPSCNSIIYLHKHQSFKGMKNILAEQAICNSCYVKLHTLYTLPYFSISIEISNQNIIYICSYSNFSFQTPPEPNQHYIKISHQPHPKDKSKIIFSSSPKDYIFTKIPNLLNIIDVQFYSHTLQSILQTFIQNQHLS